MPRWIQYVVFGAVALSVWGGVHAWVLLRFVRAVPLSGAARYVSIGLAVVLFALLPVSEILLRRFHPVGGNLLAWVSNLWIGLLFYLFVFTTVLYIVALVLRLTGAGSWAAFAAGVPGVVATCIVSLLLCAAGVRRAAAPARVKALDVSMKNLPDSLVGFRLVAVSDLHFGPIVGARRAAAMVSQINRTDPDLVVIAGDLADEGAVHLERALAAFAGLRSRHGVVASTGNHDFYAGIEAVERAAGAAGIRFLRNCKTVIDGVLHVYGIDDPASSMHGVRADIDRVIGPEAREFPSVLLYHQPLRYEKAESLGIDLMVSGHTHNGQIWPFSAMVKLAFRRTWGVYKGSTLTHCVSCGIGTWGPPMRVGAPPEIIVFRLVRRGP